MGALPWVRPTVASAEGGPTPGTTRVDRLPRSSHFAITPDDGDEPHSRPRRSLARRATRRQRGLADADMALVSSS